MFSGIVEGRGLIVAVTPQSGGTRLTVDLSSFAEGVVHGDSVSIDGVCLTVAQLVGTKVSFDVITETLKKTTLGSFSAGDEVNIERSMRVGDTIDGHFVQGHVDGVGVVVERIANAQEFKLWIAPPLDLMIYIAPRGSVAMNGVSLTIAEVEHTRFAVALIPTTLQLTNLGRLEAQKRVNIETDIIARQIVHYLKNFKINVSGV